MLQGSVAEWSKALVLGTSLLGGVGSNPTTAKNVLSQAVQEVEDASTFTSSLL